jgi:membrane-associated phospholipid phosphatase
MKSILKKIRLGEYLAISWILFAAIVFTIFEQWKDSPLFYENTWLSPFFVIILVTLCRYLLPVILISARKLGSAFTISFALEKAAPLAQASVDFNDEIQILRKMAGFFRDCAPLYLFILFYPSTDFLVNCIQGTATVDDLLIKLDLIIFRTNLSVWMEKFISPGLTEILSFCYFMHLIIPSVTLLFICLYSKRSLFLEAVQGFMLMSIIGFTLYIVVPGIGPKYTLAHLYTRDLAGGMIGTVNQVVMDTTRVARDVFPSLHVGISALLLIYAWRANRWFGLITLPFVVGNWIATIYLRYHYTIDVAAGFLLVPIVHYLVQFWMRKFPESEMEENHKETKKAISIKL